ncbi:MAG TPA: hypothetical protein VFG47_13760 [Geminicoccaceae bacterium]|nr:hypothetical protein [Geminicoccaceae bacterium]
MAGGDGDGGLIHPDALRRLAAEKEMERLKEALRRQQKAEEERAAFHRMFETQEVRLEEANRNISALVRRAAEDGKREVLALRFPSEWCTDKGRAINNFDPRWPETLTGFAKRGYEFYEKELRPAGYRIRVQILDYPGGVPGDVGVFLSW